MNPGIPALFAALAILTSAADAQDKVKVRFAAQSLPQGMPEIVMVAGDTLSQPFEISSELLTLALEAPGRAFALRAVGSEKNLATVQMPAQGSRFVVLLVPGDGNQGKTVVIPDDRKGFGPGDVFAYNAASRPVLGQLGTTRFTLPPGAGKAVRPEGIVDGQYYEVRFAVREGAGSRMFSSARWPAGEKERCYVFFHSNPENPERVVYRVISEVVHPPEKDD